MWNIRPIQTRSTPPAPEIVSCERVEPIATVASASNHSSIGRGWVIKGEITGTEPLFIDGCVEGTINLPGGLVTLGRNGQVTATISAGDIVVLGSVSGDIIASNRLEVRAEGVVTGNVTASRISIEEGAYLQTRVNSDHDESNKAAKNSSTSNGAVSKTHLVGLQKTTRLTTEPLPMSA